MIARATEYQLEALENPIPHEFQERLEWNWGAETRSVIETREGRADRIIQFRDEPLTEEQQQKQEHRLQKLLTDHDAVKGEMQDQKSETQRRIRLVRAFPEAFYFDYVGREKNVVHFFFHPNPDFSPKDRESQMYRGMEGSLWIDAGHQRMVAVEGKLVKDVSFGWGVFGKLNKGGIYEIAQAQVEPGRWRVTSLNVEMRGRIFLFDSFHFIRRETDTHFRPTPESVTYQEAVNSLLEPVPEAIHPTPAQVQRHRNSVH